MAGLFLTIAVLLSFSPKSQAFDGPPPMSAHREPGMEGDRPFGGPQESNDIKFEFKAEDKIFKDASEAKDYQTLFDKNKDSKEVTDYFAQTEKKKKEKMDEMRKSDVRPDFSKMKEEREAEKISMIKDLKIILDKKKIAVVTTRADSVKCESGKSAPILERPTTDSLKDSSKVVKVVLTEDEFARMKKDIKEEVKKEMMNDMAKNKPKDEDGDKPGPREKKDGAPPSDDNKGEKKMARSQGSKGPPRGQDSGMMNMNMSQNSGMQMMNQNQNQNQLQVQTSGMQMQPMNMNQTQSQNYSVNMNQTQNQSYGMNMNQQMPMNRQNRQMGMNSGFNFGSNQNSQGYGYVQQQQGFQGGMPPMRPMMMNNNMNSQLNSGSYSNYNNQNAWMYGQNQNQGQSAYFNPYSSNQYQMQPYQQYPMMTMGN